MICCCSMAGTSACRYCNNNSNAECPPLTFTEDTKTLFSPAKLEYVSVRPYFLEEEKRTLAKEWFPYLAKFIDDEDYGRGNYS